MSVWYEIRKLARRKHAELLAYTQGDVSAEALLLAADQITGLERTALRKNHNLLDGGDAQLDPKSNAIWFNHELSPGIARYYQAHEYAHFWLHQGHVRDISVNIEPDAGNPQLAEKPQQFSAYGPAEQREREANAYARELLLPSHLLYKWFYVEGLNASAIAERVGVPVSLVHHQLGLALLAPDIPDEPESRLSVESEVQLVLDPSQQEAAWVSSGPLLIEAGPGTGKTRTLTGRIAFLLEQGTPPEQILALTFSNKAAEEIRSRVAQIAPSAAAKIQMGTFHSFGFELLCKYGAAIGLAPRPEVRDTMGALLLLEDLLPQLPLQHYQDLSEPTRFLGDILKAISRAKDELVDPDGYRELGLTMHAEAITSEKVIEAEKVLEVAEVYRIYQEHIEGGSLLDFGDLIFRAVTLLREHPAICAEVRATYRHILVDEYQDVNRASGVLLKLIAGDGAGLWVVGDVRQAIYRFRGAAPINMKHFGKDFPNSRKKSLKYNYRSQQPIIDTFAELAPKLSASQGMGFTPWIAQRPYSGGLVSMEIAESQEAEYAGLAATITAQVAAGHSYRDQAILCRSHTSLARIAEQLERHNIPVLYLGDLFERPEIRDLLSLLSLASEGNGSGLVRVAGFVEYQIPQADVQTILRLARKHQQAFPQALALVHEAEGLSEQGRKGLVLLEKHLEGLCYGSSAWKLLVHYLFERSRYLYPILKETTVAAQQQRLAILQFIQVAYDQRGIRKQPADPKRLFLNYVRRLEQFGEERPLRQIPEWAAGIDAIRLMTMHAAKGLEFPVVYLPMLAAGTFPSINNSKPCPIPTGLTQEISSNSQMEEEECLFFVALSRARDALYLSRSQKATNGNNSNPSSLLGLIAATLKQPIDGTATWVGGLPHKQSVAIPSPFTKDHVLTEQMLSRYEDCPRRFYYEFGLGLASKRDERAYIRLYGCVYKVVSWLRNALIDGQRVGVKQALEELDRIWAEQGPKDHVYEQIYRRIANQSVEYAVAHIGQTSQTEPILEWKIDFEAGSVICRPDHIEFNQDGKSVCIQHFRMGKPSNAQKDKAIYRLYAMAVEKEFPEHQPSIEIVYLNSKHKDIVEITSRKVGNSRKKYNQWLQGIQAGHFEAKHDDRECPRCPYYFICSAPEDPTL